MCQSAVELLGADRLTLARLRVGSINANADAVTTVSHGNRDSVSVERSLNAAAGLISAPGLPMDWTYAPSTLLACWRRIWIDYLFRSLPILFLKILEA